MYSNPYQWRRIRKRVLVFGESIRAVAKKEGMSRNTLRKILAHESPPGRSGRGTADVKRKRWPTLIAPKKPRATVVRQRWMEWLYELERGTYAGTANTSAAALTSKLSDCRESTRKRILAILARGRGFSISATAEHLALDRRTVRKCLTAFDSGGIDALLGRKQRPRRADDEAFRKALFGLLHEPPSLSGHNRTTWRMQDLQKTLATRGFRASSQVIREAIRKAGFRWRAAKVVLTSTDPEYREKLERVRRILSNLGEDERFFSVDEYGPFAVKAKPGRVLAGPGESPSVPQWQKSKGWLIATAALELSTNRVTHFYSRAKNTAEMIRMAKTLLQEYQGCKDTVPLVGRCVMAPVQRNAGLRGGSQRSKGPIAPHRVRPSPCLRSVPQRH